jgi:hypothetical protein
VISLEFLAIPKVLQHIRQLVINTKEFIKLFDAFLSSHLQLRQVISDFFNILYLFIFDSLSLIDLAVKQFIGFLLVSKQWLSPFEMVIGFSYQ